MWASCLRAYEQRFCCHKFTNSESILNQRMSSLSVVIKPELFPFFYSPLKNKNIDTTEAGRIKSSPNIRTPFRTFSTPLLCKFKGPGILKSPGFSVFERRNFTKVSSRLVSCFPGRLWPQQSSGNLSHSPWPFCACHTEQRRYLVCCGEVCMVVKVYPLKETPRDKLSRMDQPDSAAPHHIQLLPIPPSFLPCKRSQKLWKYRILVLFIFLTGGRETWGAGAFCQSAKHSPMC